MTRNLFLGADLMPAYEALEALEALERPTYAALRAADFRCGLWPSDHVGVVATLGPVGSLPS